jgi:hypothetical protein
MQLTQAQRKGLLAILDRPLAIGCRLLSRGTFSALARRGLAERRRPEVLDGVAYGEAVITERGRKVAEELRSPDQPRARLLHSFTTAELIAELERRRSLPPGPFGPGE